MAAAAQQRPHRAVQGALGQAHRPAAAPAVLEEADLAARPQHPAHLAERPGHIAHAAQHQAEHHGVEGLALDRQRLRAARHHVDRDLGTQGRLHRPLPQQPLRFDGDDLRDRAGVAGEVQPVARADLQNPPGEPGEQPLPHPGHAQPGLRGHGGAGVVAREERVVDGVRRDLAGAHGPYRHGDLPSGRAYRECPPWRLSARPPGRTARGTRAP
ncbi:hypothetical protein GCM10010510_16580 [Streptomyces anandii JCM 4720]|nr:hypothetical protein GCM10010510_16580 [Streptomyces anandii JCM 4720]